MSYEYILFDASEGIATITLNRPEVLNAYQPLMGDELCDAFDRIKADDSLKAVILTGAGRAFCAGVDLEFLRDYNARIEQGEDLLPVGEERFVKRFAQELVEYPKPVIVAMNGHAIGVGITMTLACDIRIAAEGAKLAIPFARLGMLPGLGAGHLLSQIVGMGHAMELALTGKTILADEAARIGLVNHVVPAEQLMDEARAIAGRAVECNALSMELTKKLLHFGARATLSESMDQSSTLYGELRARAAKPPRP